MGTVQVQTQLVNISCAESNELTIQKDSSPLPKQPCCNIKCCCSIVCDCFGKCCACPHTRLPPRPRALSLLFLHLLCQHWR